MRILLTGANGFLGRALLEMAPTIEFVVLGRHRPEGFIGEWIEADLAEQLPVSRLPRNVDGVVHLAQSNHYRSFPAGAPDMFAVNVGSTAQLLNWAGNAGVGSFIFASTGNVYGPRAGLAAETDTPNVDGQYYAATKLAAECLVAGYGGLLATCSLRLYGLYGPHQPRDKMLGNLIARVCSGEPLTLQGNGGGYVTQLTYVADAVRVIERALTDKWRGSVNVAGPEAASIEQLGELIGQAVGRRAIFKRLEGSPPPPQLPDLTRLRSLTLGLPFTSLAEGIARTVSALPSEQKVHP